MRPAEYPVIGNVGYPAKYETRFLQTDARKFLLTEFTNVQSFKAVLLVFGGPNSL